MKNQATNSYETLTRIRIHIHYKLSMKTSSSRVRKEKEAYRQAERTGATEAQKERKCLPIGAASTIRCHSAAKDEQSGA